MRVLLLSMVGFAAPIHLLNAQSGPSFEVASIRPDRALFFGGVKTNPGRLVATSASLSDLIQQAYGVSELQIAGVALLSGRFDIEGKADGSHSRSELLQMLQSLLAERFKLRFHREMREMPVQALVTGRGVPRFQSAASKEADPLISLAPVRSGGNVGAVALTGQNVTLPMVANFLSSRLRVVVVDKTGLVGGFDFGAQVVMDRNEATDPSIPEHEVMNHLFADFVQKLGLKLEGERAPVEILVVDQAEKPDEN